MAPITPAQLRAGRALLDWSRQQLADASGISLSSVRDYEQARRGGDVGGLRTIQVTLENQGVEFLAGNDLAGPGVRLTTGWPTILSNPTRPVDGGLVIPAEWRGRKIHMYVAREVLEDLGQLPVPRHIHDQEWIDVFLAHRTAILTGATTALVAGRITPDGRVHVRHEDIPELTIPTGFNPFA